MVDREGNPLTDPTRQNGGLPLPIGGPKGYGACHGDRSSRGHC
ncbi:MAG: hypothetical protein ACR2OY_04635 [Boseongicola sp.]